ncbi:DUF2520 domain-containing protein [Zunongwangia sp. F363]|uniref:DUF2520 domain-containing protein n=1 Tax=Autumnicola tepida TaxID=3075595 RepID=A0ABU3CDQ2_9FLAO|nr:Rossmann-like and DUF2520 domain-containing protein [Zunongwangia sp. F363]MDT0644475.1 DUF2520 domain-containing protein [Zunongwangia sp. F363]
MTEVVIIGAGNVASHLFRAFRQSGEVQIVQVYNHRSEKLADFAEISTTTSLSEITQADLYIFALKDDAIAKTAAQLKDTGGLFVHTSGGVAMESLSKFKNFGVFYPLQTFSRNREISFKNIPLCLEASSEENLHKLKELGAAISENLYEINSEQRRALHVSAVFVNNFSNHLYQIGADICKKHEVPFEILRPLIAETAAKIEELSPAEAQTGPALRNDEKTINAHLELLNAQESKIYKLLTSSIQELHGKEL